MPYKNPLELSQAISPVSYSGVPKRSLIYEGQTEPDLAWLENRYNVDLKYRGDTAGDYEISGAKDDVDRFFKDHHLGLTKQYRRKNDGHNFVLYPGTPNSLFSIPDKTGESDVRLKPGQLDSEYEFIKEYLEEQ